MIGRDEITNSNELPPREDKLNSEILKIAIQLPKILITCVDEICRMTRRNRDDLFTNFVIYGLVRFYEEPERIFNFTRNTPDFLRRLRIGLNQYYGKEHFKNNIPPKPKEKMISASIDESKPVLPQSNKEFNGNEQNLEFKLILPDILEENFNIFCEITNSTKKDLSKVFIMDRLAFIYQNPELIYDYIKDFEVLKENLKTGLNLIFGRNH